MTSTDVAGIRNDRHHAIVLLERTLTDYDYIPRTASGAMASREKRGEGPTATRECTAPGCNDGIVRVRGVPRECPACGGRGVEVVDQYTERKVNTAEQSAERPRRMVRCDACGGVGTGPWWRVSDTELSNTCRRCWGARVVPGPSHRIRPFREGQRLSADAPSLAAGDPVLAAMERRANAGSYDELGLAMAALRREHPPLFRLNVRVYVEAIVEPDEVDGHNAFLLVQSLHYLSHLMPTEIVVPRWAETYAARKPWLRRRRDRTPANSEEAA